MRRPLIFAVFLVCLGIFVACNNTAPAPTFVVDSDLTGEDRSAFIEVLNTLNPDLRDSLNMVGQDNKIYASGANVRGTVRRLLRIQGNVFQGDGVAVATPDHRDLDLQDLGIGVSPQATPAQKAECANDSSGPFRRVTSTVSKGGTNAFNWMQATVYLPTGVDSGITKAEAGGFLEKFFDPRTNKIETYTNTPYIYVGGFGAKTVNNQVEAATAVDAGFQLSTGNASTAANGKWSLFFKVQGLKFPDANGDTKEDDLFASTVRFPGGSPVRLEFFHFNNILVVRAYPNKGKRLGCVDFPIKRLSS
jgi:hypothetical protein